MSYGGNPLENPRNGCSKNIVEIQRWIPACAGMAVGGRCSIKKQRAGYQFSDDLSLNDSEVV